MTDGPALAQVWSAYSVTVTIPLIATAVTTEIIARVARSKEEIDMFG